MTQTSVLLNPNGKLSADVEARLSPARKTKPLWAKQLNQSQEVETLEGTFTANSGDYLCRGIDGEFWPQTASRLHEKFVPSNVVDQYGWQRFAPKPETSIVEVTEIPTAFCVHARWGTLTGKPGDYVARSVSDPADIWIIDKSIFEKSYEFIER